MIKIFWNASLSNLKKVWQRNLRTDWARECIFKVSTGTNFENFSARYQPWWHLCRFHVCNSMPKKLCLCHCQYFYLKMEKFKLRLLYLNIWFNLNILRKRIFWNASLSNLKKVWQRNLRTDWARECTFEVSRGTDFENFFARYKPWWHLCRFHVCNCLPRKTLHMSLPVFLDGDEEASWLLFSSLVSLLSGGTVQPKHLFLYPKGDRSGLQKPKKHKHQH